MASNIKWLPDLGAPVVVTVVDMMTATLPAAPAGSPSWNSWASYAMTALGYAAAFLGYGGDFVKNVGIASAPKTLALLYGLATTGVVKAAPVASPVGYRMAQTVVPGFGNVKMY